LSVVKLSENFSSDILNHTRKHEKNQEEVG
jgi:hypothetical protein